MASDIAAILANVQQAAKELEEKSRAIEEGQAKLQRDKEAVADVQLKFASIISVNVGGTRFDTTRAALTACPD